MKLPNTMTAQGVRSNTKPLQDTTRLPNCCTSRSKCLKNDINPSIFLPDRGHYRGLSLSVPTGKRTSCHFLAVNTDYKSLKKEGPDF
ncbi:uncharacterized protein LOC117810800 isoform X1 [Notolabrus celidotus]|uniref:uncharacterized protein LOC117810800 isoform X1 n=1 Tax=Notolabrus celidotus TaxID=1203425 RepID=UPI00148FABDF|nr:uncharacterized protein LOC117810800 isoform X1 [Notolabrus celidotus]